MTACVVLAGGLGTRIQAVAGDRPKFLVPVGGAPFAHHQLSWLAREGVASVVLCIGHRGEAVRRFVGDGDRWGLTVTYVDEGDRLRGTAGALRLALEQGALPEQFLVLYGDSFLPLSIGPVEASFHRSGLPALMTVFRNQDLWQPSNARYESGLVTLYQKDHPDPATEGLYHIDYGLSVLDRKVVAELVPPTGTADLAGVLHRLSLGRQLAGYEVTERFYEVGSESGLRDLADFLARNRD